MKKTYPPDARQVFISYARPLSEYLADRFRSWFETHFPEIKTFISRADIEPGVDWHKELATVLPTCGIVVAFLTRENLWASEWMMYELGAIASGGHQDERAIMVLVDLERGDVPQDSPYAFRNNVRLSDQKAMSQLVVSLHKRCAPAGKIVDEKPIEERFRISWPQFIKDADAAISTMGSARCITASFRNDKQFASWADKYHDIVHFARDLAIRILDEANPLSGDEVAARLVSIKEEQEDEQFLDPHNPPWKSLYVAAALDKFLDLIDEVFKRIVTPGAEVWSCLRYLRKDSCYHTLSRSQHHPSRWSDKSLPWEDGVGPVHALNHTISTDARCVIIPEPGTAAYPMQHPDLPRDSKPESMMLGAVLTKQVRHRNRPINVDLWWIICLSSNRKGAFTEAHKPILQACNDVLSTVANSILRLRPYAPPQTDASLCAAPGPGGGGPLVPPPDEEPLKA